MKRIRKFWNKYIVAHALIDGFGLLAELFDNLSKIAFDLKQKAYSLFWSPVE